jgi:hypothetical protein
MKEPGRLHEARDFVKQIDADIISIQESHTDWPMRLEGYSEVTNTQVDPRYLRLFIRSSIEYSSTVDFPTPKFEGISYSPISLNDSIIIGCYWHPDTTSATVNAFLKWADKIPNKRVALFGDLNAHSFNMGLTFRQVTNSIGRALEEKLTWSCHCSDEPTFLTSFTSSFLDACLTKNISATMTPRGYSRFAGHLAQVIEIVSSYSRKDNCIPKSNTTITDWKAFKKQTYELHSATSPQDYFQRSVQLEQKCSELVNTVKREGKSWWTQECKKAVLKLTMEERETELQTCHKKKQRALYHRSSKTSL